MKNILHLSDLHLSVTGTAGFHLQDAIRIIEKLIEDVKATELSRGIKFDTIFFTGDLSNAGKKEEYENFESKIQKKILDGLNISVDNFYVLPGNHDVSRDEIKIAEREVRGSNVAVLDELFNAVNDGREEWLRLNNYFEYDKRVNSSKEYVINGALLKVIKAKNNLFLVFINSAWLAQDGKDKENLFITFSQLNKFNSLKIPNDAKIILLTHHPLEWLNPTD